MFHTIRKNRKWLFWMIIVVVIISFVIFFSPDLGGPDGRGGNVVLGTIEGKPVAREEYMDARAVVRLGFFMSRGQWPESLGSAERSGLDVEGETLRTLAMMQRFQANGIEVGSEAIAEQVKEMPIFASASGGYDPKAYSFFVEQSLPSGGLDEEDFFRFMRFQLSLRHASRVFGLTGALMTPASAEARYREENKRLMATLAVLQASNFLNQVQVTTNALTNFFQTRAAAYRVPPKVVAHYILFPASNYVEQAETWVAGQTNLTETLSAAYDARGTNAFKTEAGEIMNREDAMKALRDEFRHGQALQLARKAANDSAHALFDIKPRTVSNFVAHAEQAGLVHASTQPFSQADGPEMAGAPGNFATVVFGLNPAEPIHFQGLRGTNGVYLVALEQEIESRLQTLDEVREQVIQDYKQSQSRQLLREKGNALRTALVEGIAKGGTFAEICKTQQVETVEVPPFTEGTSELPEVSDRTSLFSFLRIAFETEVGKLSEFIPSGDSGFIVMVKEALPADETRLAEDFPGYLEDLRGRYQSIAFNDWYSSQLQQAQPALPVSETIPEPTNP